MFANTADEWRAKARGLESDLQELEDKLSDQEGTVDRLKKEKRELETRLKSSEELRERAEEKFSAVKVKEKELNIRAAELQHSLEEAKKEAAAATATANDLREQLANVELSTKADENNHQGGDGTTGTPSAQVNDSLTTTTAVDGVTNGKLVFVVESPEIASTVDPMLSPHDIPLSQQLQRFSLTSDPHSVASDHHGGVNVSQDTRGGSAVLSVTAPQNRSSVSVDVYGEAMGRVAAGEKKVGELEVQVEKHRAELSSQYDITSTLQLENNRLQQQLAVSKRHAEKMERQHQVQLTEVLEAGGVVRDECLEMKHTLQLKDREMEERFSEWCGEKEAEFMRVKRVADDMMLEAKLIASEATDEAAAMVLVVDEAMKRRGLEFEWYRDHLTVVLSYGVAWRLESFSMREQSLAEQARLGQQLRVLNGQKASIDELQALDAEQRQDRWMELQVLKEKVINTEREKTHLAHEVTRVDGIVVDLEWQLNEDREARHKLEQECERLRATAEKLQADLSHATSQLEGYEGAGPDIIKSNAELAADNFALREKLERSQRAKKEADEAFRKAKQEIRALQKQSQAASEAEGGRREKLAVQVSSMRQERQMLIEGLEMKAAGERHEHETALRYVQKRVAELEQLVADKDAEVQSLEGRLVMMQRSPPYGATSDGTANAQSTATGAMTSYMRGMQPRSSMVDATHAAHVTWQVTPEERASKQSPAPFRTPMSASVARSSVQPVREPSRPPSTIRGQGDSTSAKQRVSGGGGASYSSVSSPPTGLNFGTGVGMGDGGYGDRTSIAPGTLQGRYGIGAAAIAGVTTPPAATRRFS